MLNRRVSLWVETLLCRGFWTPVKSFQLISLTVVMLLSQSRWRGTRFLVLRSFAFPVPEHVTVPSIGESVESLAIASAECLAVSRGDSCLFVYDSQQHLPIKVRLWRSIEPGWQNSERSLVDVVSTWRTRMGHTTYVKDVSTGFWGNQAKGFVDHLSY